MKKIKEIEGRLVVMERMIYSLGVVVNDLVNVVTDMMPNNPVGEVKE